MKISHFVPFYCHVRVKMISHMSWWHGAFYTSFRWDILAEFQKFPHALIQNVFLFTLAFETRFFHVAWAVLDLPCKQGWSQTHGDSLTFISPSSRVTVLFYHAQLYFFMLIYLVIHYLYSILPEYLPACHRKAPWLFIDCCRFTCCCWGLNSGHLEEQVVL